MTPYPVSSLSLLCPSKSTDTVASCHIDDFAWPSGDRLRGSPSAAPSVPPTAPRTISRYSISRSTARFFSSTACTARCSTSSRGSTAGSGSCSRRTGRRGQLQFSFSFCSYFYFSLDRFSCGCWRQWPPTPAVRWPPFVIPVCVAGMMGACNPMVCPIHASRRSGSPPRSGLPLR